MVTSDYADRVIDWLAAHLDHVTVASLGQVGPPDECADLKRCLRVVSCDPLAAESDDDGDVVRAIAVSAYGGEEQFNVTQDPDRSSLLEPNWAVVSRHGQAAGFEVVDRRTVSSVTLAELADEYGQPDVLRLHCSGVEYQLISSALSTVSGTVCVEVSGGMVDNYVGQYPLPAMTTLLHGAGYTLVDLECVARPPVGWNGPGRHQPVEYHGRWFKDQALHGEDIDFTKAIRLLVLCRAFNYLSFGQQFAVALSGRSLLPPDLAPILCSTRFWYHHWNLAARGGS
jgi:hypothetical protein